MTKKPPFRNATPRGAKDSGIRPFVARGPNQRERDLRRMIEKRAAAYYRKHPEEACQDAQSQPQPQPASSATNPTSPPLASPAVSAGTNSHAP